MKNPVELDVYVNKLCSISGIKADALYSQLGMKRVNAAPPRHETTDEISRKKAKPGHSKADASREGLLALLISNKRLYTENAPVLKDELFEGSAVAEIFRYVKTMYESGKTVDINVMMTSLNEGTIKTLSRILSIDTHIADERKAFSDYLKVLNEEIRKGRIFDILKGGSVEALNDMIKKNNK